jgi:hypothetical protein
MSTKTKQVHNLVKQSEAILDNARYANDIKGCIDGYFGGCLLLAEARMVCESMRAEFDRNASLAYVQSIEARVRAEFSAVTDSINDGTWEPTERPEEEEKKEKKDDKQQTLPETKQTPAKKKGAKK